MKQIIRIVSLFALISLFSSCLSDSDNNSDYPIYSALTTTHVSTTAESGYYFTLDNGKMIYPGDTSRIGDFNHKDKDGKRAVIYFNLMDQVISKFDYNAALYHIDQIETKKAAKATSDEELNKFGDEPINIEEVWISGGYLNICYLAPSSYNIRKYTLSLVDNQTATRPDGVPEGYIYLEFRCVYEGEQFNTNKRDYISFELGEYDPQKANMKGIYLRLRPATTGAPRFIKLEPVKSKNLQ